VRIPSACSPGVTRLVVLALLACVPPLAAAAADAPRLRLPRLSAPPTIEDVVAGRIPEDMARVTGFVQREPGDGVPVSRATSAYAGYDDESLYVIFVCRETPGAVRAHMAKRETIDGDDMVAVFIDTFNDHRHAYGFYVNPLGIQMDALITDGQEDDSSFDTLWHSEGRVTPDGFVARLAIPFRSLRFAGSKVQSWGIGFGRFLPTRNEQSFWPFVTKKVSNAVAQLADVDGLEGISPGRNLQFIPYTAFTGSRYLDESALAYGDKREGRAGLDAKMVIKDALTLDVAINPDFSQVESDEPQVTINQRFEVQFPEKRPFFIENSSYFRTPEELFFSRRIADPRFGARLTGRAGKWTVAGLVMDDRAPGEQADVPHDAEGRATLVAVGRVVREFGRQSTAGVLVTSRDFGASSNRVASADLRLRLGDNWVVGGQAIASRTTALDGTTLAGPAFVLGASYDSRAFQLESKYTDRSPGFRSQVGFIPRSDIRLWSTEAGYSFFPRKGVTRWGPGVEASVNWDRQGRVQDWELNPEVEIEMPASTQLHLRAAKSYELYEQIGFDKHQVGFFFETQRLRWLWLNGSYMRGTGVNYYPVAGQLPFLADSRQADVGLTIRPHPAARIEGTYIYDSLTTDRVPAPPPCGCAPTAAPGSPGAVFRLHMLRTKANYQFTRALSLRAIVDYNLVNPNNAFVTLDRDRRLTADVLVTYLVNPGTALYVGYTDAYANLSVDATLPPALRRTATASTSVGRQVFVKLSYLLRY
jgi:hypothetical protein